MSHRLTDWRIPPVVSAILAYLRKHPDRTKAQLAQALPYSAYTIHEALMRFEWKVSVSGRQRVKFGRPRQTYRATGR